MSNLLRRLLALCLFFSLQPAWGESNEKLTVLNSIRPLALLVNDLVAGLPVEVQTLLPASADPHNWTMRVSDRQRLAAADLVVWLGPDFESFLDKPLRNRPEAQLELGVLPGLHWPAEADHHSHNEHHHDHHHSGRDMHLWLNPANAIELQTALAAKIAEKRPQWEERLQQRLQQQTAELSQLQRDIQQRLANHRQRGFIAYHDAYGHFVDAFALHQLAAVNQSSEQQLSAKGLHQLQVQARGAHCLMAEKKGSQERRLAQRLGLPLVVADGLALDPELQTFADLLRHIAVAFETCTSFVAN